MENRKIDLKKHASEKGSTWYLVKLIFYIICIVALSVILYFQYNKMKTAAKVSNTQIEGVTVELPD